MKVSFSGADDEFLNCNQIEIKEKVRNLEEAIFLIYSTVPRAHKSFFKSDGTLAPGVVCLIDDVDSCVENSEINSESHLVFISTLHGG
jgi:hypothetical protein